ncbi:MAG TPA: TonB family protein [Bacteroidales bacterium]|jgi:protein TonB|nr:TonB family protein [Bacteroidales bacterium]
MKKLLVPAFLLHALCLNSQKIFLDENKTPLKDSVKAEYFKLIIPDDNPNVFNERCFFITGENESETQYIRKSKKNLKNGKSTTWYKNGTLKNESDYSNNELQGKSSSWHENGRLKSEIDFTDNKYNGIIATYWQNGNIKRKDYFKKGKFENGTCYDSSGNQVKHYDYEIMPEYKGGDQGLLNDISANLIYPEISRSHGIQGTVIVRFVVKEDGVIDKIDILQGVNTELNNEAMRVVSKLNRFKPGFCDGEPTPVYYMVPIHFILK